MDALENLAHKKPRENAGARSSNRFMYQLNWGLRKLLDMEAKNEDYVMVLDYHDDIVICNSESQSEYIDFYQVKTKSRGNWTQKQLVRSYIDDEDDNEKNDDELMKESGQIISILGKLISHVFDFKQTRNLYIVTNALLSDSLFKKSVPEVSFQDLNADAQKNICKIVREELHRDIPDEDFYRIIFLQNQMGITDYRDTMIGYVGRFLKEKLQCSADAVDVYNNVISSLKQKNDYEECVSTKNDLLKLKAVTHTSFSKYLNSLKFLKNYNEIRAEISRELTDCDFSIRQSIANQLQEISNDVLNYDNLELQELGATIKSIRNNIALPSTCWMYVTEIYDELMQSYQNIMNHSEMYIKAYILYIIVYDRY